MMVHAPVLTAFNNQHILILLSLLHQFVANPNRDSCDFSILVSKIFPSFVFLNLELSQRVLLNDGRNFSFPYIYTSSFSCAIAFGLLRTPPMMDFCFVFPLFCVSKIPSFFIILNDGIWKTT